MNSDAHEAGPTPVRSGLTRRHLVTSAAAGAATASLAALGRFPGVASARERANRSPLRRSSYTNLKTTRFRVGRNRHALELVAVEDLPIATTVPSLRGREGAFAIRFQGAADGRLASRTRTVRHPQFGRFKLFISPIGTPGDSQDYEAIVNRVPR